jgi:sec-independent protein translocase protein TatA
VDALGPWHLLIIAGFFVLLFGAKKLPDAARSLGRSARIMKTELKGLNEEPKPADPVAVEAHAEPIRAAVADEILVPVRDDGAR